MQQPNRSITVKGEISAGGSSSGEATLTIYPTQIILKSFIVEYRLEPQQVFSLNIANPNSVIITHTLIEYPVEICFSPLNASASEVVEQIRMINFIPSASAEDIPAREGIPVRLQSLIPMIVLVLSFMRIDNLLGWVKVQPQQLGQYSPLGMSCLFLICIIIRLIPFVQTFLLMPGRHVGEIIHSINGLILLSGILAVASILVVLGVPELIVIALCCAFLWMMTILKDTLSRNSGAI